MLVRVRKNGQITLPAKICKAIHIKEGDLLDVQVDDKGRILLRPMKLIEKHDETLGNP